jgi:hypothetical protein
VSGPTGVDGAGVKRSHDARLAVAVGGDTVSSAGAGAVR